MAHGDTEPGARAAIEAHTGRGSRRKSRGRHPISGARAHWIRAASGLQSDATMNAFLNKLRWAGVFTTQTFVAGCGGSAMTDNGRPDANATPANNSGGDASPSNDLGADDAAACTGSLDDLKSFAGCPEAYAVAGGIAQFCGPGAPTVYFGTADGLAVVSVTVAGEAGSLCVYRSTDGVLVGISVTNDIPKFCNSTSRVESAGVPYPPGLQTELVDCSGIPTAATDASITGADTGITDGSSMRQGDSATACTGSLADLQSVAGCPDAYSVAAGRAQLCDAGSHALLAVESGDDLSVLVLEFGAGASQCVYRSTDDALVGISITDDVPSFCNHTSNVESAGVQTPPGLPTTGVSCLSGTGTPDADADRDSSHDADADSGGDSGD
jgi:hypothetical protein